MQAFDFRRRIVVRTCHDDVVSIYSDSLLDCRDNRCEIRVVERRHNDGDDLCLPTAQLRSGPIRTVAKFFRSSSHVLREQRAYHLSMTEDVGNGRDRDPGPIGYIVNRRTLLDGHSSPQRFTGKTFNT